MNISIKAVPAQPLATSLKVKKWEARQMLQAILLAALVVFSSFAVVYIKDLYRRMFIHYQDLQDQQTQLYVDWGKLLLEQSTWSTQGRVQKIASDALNMQVPLANQIKIVSD